MMKLTGFQVIFILFAPLSMTIVPLRRTGTTCTAVTATALLLVAVLLILRPLPFSFTSFPVLVQDGGDLDDELYAVKGGFDVQVDL